MPLERKAHHKSFDPRKSSLSRGTKGLSRAKASLRREGNFGGLKVKPYRSLKTRKGLKDELDRITSLLVRARDKRCVTCGTTENLECSHYFKRTFLATRWNLTNCNAQCSRENRAHNVNPFPYRKYMVKLIGEDGLDELFKLRNSVWRPSDDELKSLLESHRALLRMMKRAA